MAGAIVAVAAFLAGRPEWLDAMGRGFAKLFGVASDLSTPDTAAGRWMAEHLDLLRIAGVAVAIVVLLFVTGSLTAVVVVFIALAVYELALSAYAVGVPRELDESLADDTEDAGRLRDRAAPGGAAGGPTGLSGRPPALGGLPGCAGRPLAQPDALPVVLVHGVVPGQPLADQRPQPPARALASGGHRVEDASRGALDALGLPFAEAELACLRRDAPRGCR